MVKRRLRENLGIKKFLNIPEIIKTYKKYYPKARIEKAINKNGELCLRIIRKTIKLV